MTEPKTAEQLAGEVKAAFDAKVDQVTRIARDRCIAIRRPAYRKAPASAKPVQLAANGVLSVNEA